MHMNYVRWHLFLGITNYLETHHINPSQNIEFTVHLYMQNTVIFPVAYYNMYLTVYISNKYFLPM